MATPIEPLPAQMFARIIAADVTIKSQQRDEPDLTDNEKFQYLQEMLDRSPAKFLMKYGGLLLEHHLVYFKKYNDYEITFRLRELQKNLSDSSRKVVRRNRRYECLKKLMDEGVYFREKEMRQREPLLYEYYIGQYLTPEEHEALDQQCSDVLLSDKILHQADVKRREDLLLQQREAEEMVEYESSSEDEDFEPAVNPDKDSSVGEKEKRKLQQEFLRTMQLKFLNGEEKEFDYSKVDNNVEYDSIEQRCIDEEEKYFDSEEPT